MDDEVEDLGLLDALKSTALLPVRAVISPFARRNYVRSILLSLAAFGLGGLAMFAYTGFYFSYIPQLGFSRAVHLDWEPAFLTTPLATSTPRHDISRGFPSGELAVKRGELIAGQAYDVRIRLHMPRAPVNTEAGNFMIDMRMLAPPAGTSRLTRSVLSEASDSWRAVAHARRPAILKYVSPMVEKAGKLVRFGFYTSGWREEDEWIEVKVFDRVTFAYASDVPQRVRVELRSEQRLWVYDCVVEIRARFSGLRWLMYNHRIFSFIVFTFTFWVAEMLTALAFWLVSAQLSDTADDKAVSASRQTGKARASEKEDESATEGLSDASRQFPTFSRQPPLRYSSPRVKSEDEGSGVKRESDDEESNPMAGRAVEADDEDEDADFVLDDLSKSGEGLGAGEGRSDSGLGTSMESGSGGGSGAGSAGDLRRRRSQRGL